jgi:hypothetical protein
LIPEQKKTCRIIHTKTARGIVVQSLSSATFKIEYYQLAIVN